MPGLDDGLRVDATFRLAAALAHNNQLKDAALSLAAEAARTAPGPGLMRLQAAHFMWEGMQAAEDDGPARSRRLTRNADHLKGRDNAERALLTLRAFDAMVRGENAQLIVDLCERALIDGSPARGLGWTDSEWGFELPTMVGITYTFVDQLDRAESLFGEAVRAFEISGWSGAHLAFAHTLLGMVHRRRGRLAEAEGFLREGLRLADRVGSGLPVHWDAACLLIDTLLARGRTEEARRIADRYDFGPPYPSAMVLPDGPCMRGRLLLAEGRKEEAIAELEAAGAALESRERFNGIWAPWAATWRGPWPRTTRPARPISQPGTGCTPNGSARRPPWGRHCAASPSSRPRSGPRSCSPRRWATWRSPPPPTSTPSPGSTTASRSARTGSSPAPRSRRWPAEPRGWPPAPNRHGRRYGPPSEVMFVLRGHPGKTGENATGRGAAW